MSAPTHKVQINGGPPVTGDELNTYTQYVTNVTDLRGFIGVDTMTVYMLGTTTPGDGGQGSFYWNASGTAPDDNGTTTVVPTGVVQGEWTRLPFTAIGDLTVDNLTVTGNETVGGTLAVTGIMTGATPTAGDNSTQEATTAFVRTQMIPTIQVYTSGSGSYTPPAKAYFLRIRMVGGGGGGGSVNSTNSGGAGANGSTSTFSGGTLAAGGGQGGGNGGGGGAGGTSSGGNVLNAVGSGGGASTVATAGFPGGQGGSSLLGGGAPGTGTSGTGLNGAPATANSGGGGGGASSTASGTTTGSASGGGGGGYVEHILSSPTGSYTYSVGAGGAGGVATGTSIAQGGAGGSGTIIIEAY